MLVGQETQNIKIEMVDKTKTNEGIEHTLKLFNGSSFTIKKYSLSLSYLRIINGGNARYGNSDKVIATEITENIVPGGEVTLQVFVPYEYYNGKNLDLERVYIDFNGYFNEVKEKNKFFISGDAEALKYLK